MKSLTLVLSTILALCQLSPTLQFDAILSSNADFAPLYFIFPNFLTTSATEVEEHLTRNGFRQKTTLGFVATNRRACNGNAHLIPLYRFHNNFTQYALSTNKGPLDEVTEGYMPAGIVFYTSATPDEQCGLTVALHSYWVSTHYVYTTDKTNADATLVKREGGRYKGIVCYISLSEGPPLTTELPTTTRRTTPGPTTPRPTTTMRTTPRPATTMRTTRRPTTAQPPPPNCPVDPVALLRLFKPRSSNHFYTTSESEANSANGYNREDSPGRVAKSATDCSCGNHFISIYRLYNPGIFGLFEDHFYTANEGEANQATKYNRQGIAFYCSATKDFCGATVPLYRYWRGTDHFYTSNIGEGDSNVIPYGGRYEGIVCYIWP